MRINMNQYTVAIYSLSVPMYRRKELLHAVGVNVVDGVSKIHWTLVIATLFVTKDLDVKSNLLL